MPEMARILDIPKATVYSILNSKKNKGIFVEVMVGARRHITVDSFEKWYAGQDYYYKKEDEPEGYLRPSKTYLESLTGRKAAKMLRGQTIKRSGNPEYVTREEAAEIADVSDSAISYWLRKGFIKKITGPGNIVRIPRKSLEDYLSQRHRRKGRKSGRNHKKK
ncbi:MAG: helix-turn-helix domain-containing protein [Lachnospiraceae bacterium]|nr:helix-turn-helix domain-containing protein [Lachnospiraceae bacterium]